MRNFNIFHADRNRPGEITTLEDLQRYADLNWRTERAPVFAKVEGQPPIRLEDVHAIVRSDTKAFLGTVGSRQTDFHNHEAFSLWSELVDSGAITPVSGGHLQGGAKCFIQAKINGHEHDVLPGDTVEPWLTLAWGHTGQLALTGFDSFIRIVCQNTFTMAVADRNERAFSLKHTASIKDRAVQAQALLTASIGQAQRTVDMFRDMLQVKLNQASMVEMVDELIPASTPEPSTKIKNAREAILHLAEYGAGSDIRGVRGTGWALFNGVTDFVDHQRGEGRDASTRLESATWGSGAQLKAQAARVILAAA